MAVKRTPDFRLDPSALSNPARLRAELERLFTTIAQALRDREADLTEGVSGAGFLPLAGGTLTGNLVLSGDPTTALMAATKQYADAAAAIQQQLAKAWVNFNGTGTIAINDHYNVSGLTDNGTGDYTTTWDTDFGSAYYAAAVLTHPSSGRPAMHNIQGTSTQLAGSLRFRMTSLGGGGSTYTLEDCDVVDVVAFGDQ